jgi:thioredoxin reductase (NADPH)
MADETYDVVIIGAGAAGLTAGMYASRGGLKTLLIERMMSGGQVVNAEKIENYPGFPDGLHGAEFGPLLQDQAIRNGLEIRMGEVDGLTRDGDIWQVSSYGENIPTRVVIVAGGSTLRKLGIPGEEELHGAGVSYCATCDGGFFTGQTVGVVGGGDSALDEALVLTQFAEKVIIFHRRDSFRAEKVWQERVAQNPKIEVRWNTTVEAVLGEGEVTGVSITDTVTGETSRVDLSGLFIYVGLDPNTEYLQNLLELDNSGHVPTDIWMRTALDGLFAAGDIRQHSAAQLVTAAGDGATAAIAARRYLESLRARS